MLGGDYPGNTMREQRAALTVVPREPEPVATVFDGPNDVQIGAAWNAWRADRRRSHAIARNA